MSKEPPDRIWLQIGDPAVLLEEEAHDYPGRDNVTWCDERIYSNDVEYVRADMLPQPLVEADHEPA